MPFIQKNGPQVFVRNDMRSNLTGAWRSIKPVFEEKTPPCRHACPAGNPIAEVMTLIAQGKIEQALRTIKEDNPLPGVLGRVCPHPCTSSCNRSTLDTPLNINSVERFLGDAQDKFGLCLPQKAAASGKRMAVVGSGPAGLGCAYHGAILGHGVTLVEADAEIGGLLRSGIPPYRLPRHVLDRDLAFLKALDIKLWTGVEIDPPKLDDLLDDFDAVCIATGAHDSYHLKIKGENLTGVWPGLTFLKKLHLGRPIPLGKRTIVVGGGNTAIDAARCARRLGSKVLILYRRTRDDMPAFSSEIDDALEEGVELRTLAAPLRIEGNNGKVSRVHCVEMRPGELDDSGRPRPMPVDGSEFDVEADTLIAALGESASPPISMSYSDTGGNTTGIDPWGRTSKSKLFICGDAGPNERTVAHAMGSGKRAAIAINESFNKRNTDEIEPHGKTSPDTVLEPTELNLAYFKESPSLQLESLPISERLTGFEEVHSIGKGDGIIREAERCFSCGVCNECGNCFLFCPDMSIITDVKRKLPDFEKDYCKGCGICAKECPRGIINMVEEIK